MTPPPAPSAARPRACCATNPSSAPPPTSAPGCSSSTSDRGATRRCATPACPTGSAPSSQRRAAEHRAKILLIRRFSSTPDGDGLRVFAAYADPVRPRLEAGRLADPREVLDVDLGSLRARRHERPDAVRRVALLRLHQRPSRRVLRREGPAGREGARPARIPRRRGRSRTSAATGSRPTWWCCRTGSTTAGSTRSRRSRSPARTSPASSTSTTCAAARRSRWRSRPPRSSCAASSARPGRTRSC